MKKKGLAYVQNCKGSIVSISNTWKNNGYTIDALWFVQSLLISLRIDQQVHVTLYVLSRIVSFFVINCYLFLFLYILFNSL